MTDYHAQFLALIKEVEARFPVGKWVSQDVPAWPLARKQFYLSLYWQRVGDMNSPDHKGSIIRRTSASVATPLLNLWRLRSDLGRLILFARQSYALFHGHPASLDLVNGAWLDRFLSKRSGFGDELPSAQ